MRMLRFNFRVNYDNLPKSLRLKASEKQKERGIGGQHTMVPITVDRLKRLPVRLRVAWASSVVQQVLNLYSAYFLEKYRQHDALECVWRFAVEGDLRHAEIEEIHNAITALADNADREGYSWQEIGMVAELLSEIEEPHGLSAYVAVENAATAYATKRLYEYGIRPCAETIDTEYFDSLQEPVWVLADEVLVFLEQTMDTPISTDQFARFVLKLEPVDAAKLRNVGNKAYLPPINERIP